LFASAEQEIGILAYAARFLAEDHGILGTLAEMARTGVRIRILLGDPEGSQVAERGAGEGIGDAIAAKARNAIALYQPLAKIEDVEIRLHNTTLYASIYRADDDFLINAHAYGVSASHAPVILARHNAPADFAETYLESTQFPDGQQRSKEPIAKCATGDRRLPMGATTRISRTEKSCPHVTCTSPSRPGRWPDQAARGRSAGSAQSPAIDNSSEPPHGGSWDAWLDGYGSTHTDSLSQQVTISATATTATLSFWQHIDTAETGTTAYDTFKIQILNSSGPYSPPRPPTPTPTTPPAHPAHLQPGRLHRPDHHPQVHRQRGLHRPDLLCPRRNRHCHRLKVNAKQIMRRRVQLSFTRASRSD
jgi:hypothetical protein